MAAFDDETFVFDFGENRGQLDQPRWPAEVCEDTKQKKREQPKRKDEAVDPIKQPSRRKNTKETKAKTLKQKHRGREEEKQLLAACVDLSSILLFQIQGDRTQERKLMETR